MLFPSVCSSVCLIIRLSICAFVCLSVHLPACVSVSLHLRNDRHNRCSFSRCVRRWRSRSSAAILTGERMKDVIACISRLDVVSGHRNVIVTSTDSIARQTAAGSAATGTAQTATEIIWHKTIDDGIGTALQVRQQVYYQLKYYWKIF